MLPFISALVEQEVTSTLSSSVLFRSNSMAIRVLSAFGRLAGEAYLRSVLGDLVREVCSDPAPYDPDPQVCSCFFIFWFSVSVAFSCFSFIFSFLILFLLLLLSFLCCLSLVWSSLSVCLALSLCLSGCLVCLVCLVGLCFGSRIFPKKVVPAEQAAKNIAHIASISARFLAQIMSSEMAFPASFQVICRDVRRIVGQKFNDFWPRAVGGFFFLRFVCPAIASPTTSGLLDPGFNVTKNSRRLLILITKVLQNIANQTMFNEEWMHPLNKLAQEQIPVVEAFLERMSADQSEAVTHRAQAELGSKPTPVLALIGALDDLHDTFSALVGGGGDEAMGPALTAALKTLTRMRGVGGNNPFQGVPAFGDSEALAKPTSGPKPFWDPGVADVLNASIWVAPFRDAELVAYSLANTATTLVREQLTREAGPVVEESALLDWAEQRRAAEFAEFERALSELHHVRLEPLGADARLAFWVNVYNCMIFTVFVHAAGKPGKMMSETMFAVCGHLFSCDDVAYGVLRGNNTRLATSKLAGKQFKPEDPRRTFITKMDSTINFCCVTFQSDSPVLRAYDRDYAGFRRAAELYCGKFLLHDLKAVEVTVPKLLDEQKLDWTEEDPVLRVLKLVSSKFVAAKQQELTQLLAEQKCHITVSKSKGPAHSMQWLTQMLTDEKDRREAAAAAATATAGAAAGTSAPGGVRPKVCPQIHHDSRSSSSPPSYFFLKGLDRSKSAGQVTPPTSWSATPPSTAPSAGPGAPTAAAEADAPRSPRAESPRASTAPPASPGLEGSTDAARTGWSRVQRSVSSSNEKPPVLLAKRGVSREPRQRQGSTVLATQDRDSPPLSGSLTLSGTPESGAGSPAGPPLAHSTGSVPFVPPAPRRSPRSPRAPAKSLFDQGEHQQLQRKSAVSWDEQAAEAVEDGESPSPPGGDLSPVDSGG